MVAAAVVGAVAAQWWAQWRRVVTSLSRASEPSSSSPCESGIVSSLARITRTASHSRPLAPCT